MKDITRFNREMGCVDLRHPEKYVPWLCSRDVSSGSGRRHVVPDFKLDGRMIHLMSGLEEWTYYMLRGNDKVIELFEQYPLNLKLTKSICSKLQISHPRIPGKSEKCIMTTDFLAYVRHEDGTKRFHAYAVKPERELQDVRVLDKLEIERIYWKNKGVKWSAITERNINYTYAKNVKLIASGYKGYESSDSYSIMKYLIAQGYMKVNMEKPIDLAELLASMKGDEIYVKFISQMQRHSFNSGKRISHY